MRSGRSRTGLLRPIAVGVAAMLLALSWLGGPWSRAQGAATVRIEPPLVELPPGETATVSIRVEDVTDLYCFELKVGFDPTKVEVVDADPDAAGVQIADGDFLSTDWKLQNAADNQEGTIAYALCQLNPTEPRSGSGTLATITWRAKEQGTSPVDLHDVVLAAPHGVEIPASIEDGQIAVRSSQPAPASTATPSPTAAATATSPRPFTTPTPEPPSPTPERTATPVPPTPTPQKRADAEAAEAPTATATLSPSSTWTPTPRAQTSPEATRPPTATATPGGATAPTSTSRPEPGATSTPEPSETPTYTAIAVQPTSTPEPTASGGTPRPTKQTNQTQASQSGLFGSSSPTLIYIALACLILGAGALALASVLWRRRQR